MISIDLLIQPVTEDQALETFLSILETLKLPARSWRKGGVNRTILRAVARMYAGFSLLISDFIKAGFLDTSSGNWLTLLAYFVYGVTRPTPTFATGSMTFINGGGGLFGPYAPDTVRVICPATKKAYTNSAAFTLNPGQTLAVDFRAVEQGGASSAAPGSITQLETTMIAVTVTNVAAFVGTDAMVDDDLKLLCKDKLGTLSGKGPRGAYRYAVLSALRVDGVTPINVNRVSIVRDRNTGVVTTYCASPTGAPIAGDVDQAAANVEKLARSDVATANTVAATPVALSNAITVWATQEDGLNAADLAVLVANKLIAAVAIYPIGGKKKPPSVQGYLYGDFIDGVVKSAHPSIFDIDGTSDLALADAEVCTLATTIDIRLVEAA